MTNILLFAVLMSLWLMIWVLLFGLDRIIKLLEGKGGNL